jgi:outer membrane biosynthesis protein TonB
MAAFSIGCLASAEEARSPASGSPIASAPADPTLTKSDGAVATAPTTSEQDADAAQREYVRLLAAEVNRQAHLQLTVFEDSVVVVFTIGASGRVTDYKLESATNRQQVEPIVRDIMAAIRTPPPPGGSFEARQAIRFAGMTRGRLPTD